MTQLKFKDINEHVGRRDGLLLKYVGIVIFVCIDGYIQMTLGLNTENGVTLANSYCKRKILLSYGWWWLYIFIHNIDFKLLLMGILVLYHIVDTNNTSQ